MKLQKTRRVLMQVVMSIMTSKIERTSLEGLMHALLSSCFCRFLVSCKFEIKIKFARLTKKILKQTRLVKDLRFDPPQKGQRLLKLINDSLSQVWPKEQLNFFFVG